MIQFFHPLLALALVAEAGARAVVIDGAFEDWDQAFTTIAAPAVADRSLGAAAALWQPDALYLNVSLNALRNLQSMPATLAVVFLASPGAVSRARYRGRDAVWVLEFSPPNSGADRSGAGRSGARMRAAQNDGWQHEADTLAGTGVLSAPTFSSNRFEIRIPRSVIPAGAAALALAHWDDRRPVEWSATVELSAIATAPAPAPRLRPALERPAGSALRVLSWNVGGEGFEPHLRTLAAMAGRWQIDLLLLDEAPPGLGAGLRDALPSGWSVVAGTSGGRQRGVLASAHPLLPVPEFTHLAYPDEALELVSREGTEFMRRDLSRAGQEGVAAAGAVLELGDRRWLLVSADLQCCGRDGSVEDRMRVHQAGAIRNAIERVAASRPGLSGVLFGGDLNLVGSRTPLEILAGRPDAAAGVLEPVRALQLDGLSNHTWGPAGERFPPGRLDFLLHSPALEVIGAVVLDPADLSADERLLAELAAASDHHPVVVDFRLLSPVGGARPAGVGNSRSGDR